MQNIESEGTSNGLPSQRLSIEEDDLVSMTRSSHSQSTFSPENMNKRKSKKNKEGEEPVSGKFTCQPHTTLKIKEKIGNRKKYIFW